MLKNQNIISDITEINISKKKQNLTILLTE